MPAKWNYQAELIAACICDWGCPCNFNAKPTQGYCEGMYAGHITAGVCGETRLDGVKWALAAKWPGAIHEGGGVCKIWIDQTASEPQRRAMEEILKGQHGGKPWGILAATIDQWLTTTYVPFEWTYDEHLSYCKAGNEVQVVLDAMRNPVTGAETHASVVLPDGLVTKQLEATSTKVLSIFSKELKIIAPGKYGFYCTVEHGN